MQPRCHIPKWEYATLVLQFACFDFKAMPRSKGTNRANCGLTGSTWHLKFIIMCKISNETLITMHSPTNGRGIGRTSQTNGRTFFPIRCICGNHPNPLTRLTSKCSDHGIQKKNFKCYLLPYFCLYFYYICCVFECAQFLPSGWIKQFVKELWESTPGKRDYKMFINFEQFSWFTYINLYFYQ